MLIVVIFYFLEATASSLALDNSNKWRLVVNNSIAAKSANGTAKVKTSLSFEPIKLSLPWEINYFTIAQQSEAYERAYSKADRRLTGIFGRIA